MEYADILTAIRRIVRSVHLESKRIDKEYGISIPQLLCLKFLQQQPRFRASHKGIKEYLSLNASTVTGIVNRLEKKGLIAKLPKGDDRRVNWITLTAKGSDLIEDTPELLQDRLTKKLKNIPAAELYDLKKAFDLIAELMDVSQLEASPILTAEFQAPDENPEQDL